MKSYIAVDDLNRSKFHPLPYTHIIPADIKDAEVYERGWNDAIDAIIENAPTADVRENVHAEWLPYEFGTKRWHKCSACGIADEYINEKGLEARREFCPHCGAQMDKRRRKNE